jgi:hypothetical protein
MWSEMTEPGSSALGVRPGARKENMKSKPKIEPPKTAPDDDMLPEYDFTGAVRGKYYERYRQGRNVVLLDPDVAAVFRDGAVVNDALRLLVSLAEAKVSSLRASTETQDRPNKPLQPASIQKRSGGQRKAAK